MSQENPVHVALGYVFDEQNAVLLTQRPAHKTFGQLWEFPGGKLEPGESAKDAIVRELQEELCIHVTPAVALTPYFYTLNSGQRLCFHPILCDWQPAELTLTEHLDSRFVPVNTLGSFPLAPPDYEAVERLKDYLQHKNADIKGSR